METAEKSEQLPAENAEIFFLPKQVGLLFYGTKRMSEQIERGEEIKFRSQRQALYEMHRSGARETVLEVPSGARGPNECTRAILSYSPEPGEGYRAGLEMSFESEDSASQMLKMISQETDFCENYSLSREGRKIVGRGLGGISADAGEIFSDAHKMTQVIAKAISATAVIVLQEGIYSVIPFSEFPIEEHFVRAQLREYVKIGKLAGL